jgi:hypothetical protein
LVKLIHDKELDLDSNSDPDGENSGLTSNSRFYYPISSKSLLSTLDLNDYDYLAQLPNYHLDGSFGVDKVRLSLTLDPNSVVHADFLDKVYGSSGIKTNGTVKLPGQPGIYMSWPDTGKQIMSITFNPSNFSRKDGWEICPPPMLAKYSEEVIRAVLSLGDPQARPSFMAEEEWGVIGPWPRDWTAHVGISMLHLARDFRVTDSRFDLEQMRSFKPLRMGAVKLVLGADGKVETVTHTCGKDTARHQVYDKHRERKKALANKKQVKVAIDPIPEGTFRYEVQIPRVALRKSHIDKLDVLIPDRINKIALNYWANSNYQSPLIWEGQIATEMGTVLSDTEIAESLQLIRNQALGVSMNYSPAELRRIERLIKKAGVSKKVRLTSQGMPYGHLDFISGEIALLS